MRTVRAKQHKIRRSVHFRRPKTLYLRRKPKFPRKSAAPIKGHDFYDLIRYPVTTESAMQKVEKLNTLVFIVSMSASKPKIKRAFEKLYNVKIRKINTLITPKGEKKAYIRLLPQYEALDVANKIGVV
ncbi:putative ribosomal protein L23a [Monocercomonoides exilis]|uniref:putative ribosomal protein L23a n=1 Tax=Monocercomonoides exilis TaxID=2049356 RepID=UPI0035596ACF|nr:putative ribosomal protein L23a [Monocercomonoides exilis]|eukprot:MONOS_11210.1-p1 / transcript=MONOS_11210.1 / gene=MONOS_11210 / organism=Monocercomonoides_exilis_PA203 / gene_product=ribosomal protein L23a / transcript_product=ribosomal protein L23a / location=Mono_scaffold00550:34844-35480(+) / protein_length=128 / sequence_SO=supercontig / SO=protein_coding / is_pseudo=false